MHCLDSRRVTLHDARFQAPRFKIRDSGARFCSASDPIDVLAVAPAKRKGRNPVGLEFPWVIDDDLSMRYHRDMHI